MGSRSALSPLLMGTTAVGLAVGVPAAIWGLIPFDPFDLKLDYAWRPDVAPAARTWIGIVGLAVAVVLLVPAVVALSVSWADWQWGSGVLVPVACFGVLIGFVARIAATGIIGADIGGAPLMFLGGIVALALLFVAMHRFVKLIELADQEKNARG